MNIPVSILEELPGIAAAFDEDAMRGHMQAALFGPGASGFALERCEPGRPLYMPGECCTVQYELQARSRANGTLLQSVAGGRVYPDRSSCAAYMTQKLAPLVARSRGRAELAMLAAPAAVIAPLHVLVHVWPLDGELPALLDATDPRRMVAMLGESLGESLPERLVIEDLEIERVSYRRRRRCVLRYTITGRPAGSGEPRRLVVYGKLTPRGETLDGPTLARLHDHLARGDGLRVAVPRSLGWNRELGLALLEEVPGEASIGSALRARLEGQTRPDVPSLEAMLCTCARVAALLHSSRLELGPTRTFDDRLVELQAEIAVTRAFAPELAERARGWADRLAARARASEALPACLCHGDFKYAQVLFDGERVGMVDLDTLCRSEPALDLGQFIAYLRTRIEKSAKTDSSARALADELGERFLGEYLRASGSRVESDRRLRDRTALHEAASLARMALHSRQRFKQKHLEGTTALVEERIAAWS